MTTTAVVNIGKLVSGDLQKGLLSADTILIRDGKFDQIGWRKDLDISGVDHVVDVKGMAAAPGLIDGHVHAVIGDWTPRQSTLGWMEGVFHGGVTTVISQGPVHLQGRPRDPAGIKALAILGAKWGQNYRPGGGLKVHGGCFFVEKGLTDADFAEMAREGVELMGEIGGNGLYQTEEVLPYVELARKYGMKVPMHFGGRSVPGSAKLYAKEVLDIKPDVVVHINGGPTSAPVSEAEILIDETSCWLEVIHNGNPRILCDFVRLMKEKGELHRLIIGTDSPVGTGVMPLGMIRTVIMVSALGEIPAEQALAMASGMVAEAYGLRTGKIEVGCEADLIALDAPYDCYVDDALQCIEYGDIPAVGLLMVDGEVISLRARNTTISERKVSVDGVEASYEGLEDTILPPLLR